MAFFGNNDEVDEIQRINLDDLYVKKHQSDLYKLSIYRKVLERVKSKIQLVSRRSKDEQYCWYILPEVMLGAPTFNKEECAIYVINELRENEFVVRYTHPNLIFVSWQHWVPEYVRDQIKKQTGLIINGMGETIGGKKKQIAPPPSLNMNEPTSSHADMFPGGIMPNVNLSEKASSDKTKKPQYRSVSTYEPSGILSYSRDIMKGLSDKLSGDNVKI